MTPSKPLALALAFPLLVSAAAAKNPIFTDACTADPAALVSGGRVYIYAGHDEAKENVNGYEMREWLCYSSDDMVHWTSHGSPLSVKDFAWAKQDAWAGQVIEKHGKFYWYVPMSHGTIPGFSIGVAVADSPVGPFKDAKGSAIITNDMTKDVSIGWDDIDPSVFTDDDGATYLFWGNQRCRYVKLKDNMIDFEGEIHGIDLPDYTEAPWVHKHGNLYYLSFATGFPERTAYATAEKVTGPWTYRGVIKPLAGNCNTNHQAIIDFKGRSYFVYHNGGLPTGGSFRRSVCIEDLHYNADGTLQMIAETEAGATPAK